MSKLKRALKKAAAYSAGGSVGRAPKSNRLAGEFRLPLAPGDRNILPYGKNPRNVDRELGARRQRDPNEEMPGNWYGAVTASRADGGSVIDDLRESLEMRDAAEVSPEQRAANNATNFEALMSATPVIGNAMSAEDAFTSGRQALEAVRDRRWKDAAKETAFTGLNTLGAVTGLPWGRGARNAARGASSRVNVLVPAVEGAATDTARQMRVSGNSNDHIWRTVNRVISPDGSVRQEIPDMGMKLKGSPKPGDVLPASHFVSHPRLFTKHPELGAKPVFVTDAADRAGNPVVRTLEGGAGYQVNPDTPDIRSAMAKLFQYDINDANGLARPMRHGTSVVERDLDGARAAADMLDPKNRAAVDAYLDQLAAVRDNYDMRREVETMIGGGRGKSDAAALVGRNSTGNIEGRTAALRARLDPGELKSMYPYRRVQGMGSVDRLPKWEDAFSLPPAGAEGDDLLQFIERWHQFGNGRGRTGFANGGRAAARGLKKAGVTIGAVRGKTGGRADALPVDVPAGCYVIPADVVAALGEGNTEAGMHQLEQKFGRARKANGGTAPGRKPGASVPILISDGEFVVPPDAVERFGGHDRMDDFVLAMRKAFADHLSNLPGPNQ